MTIREGTTIDSWPRLKQQISGSPDTAHSFELNSRFLRSSAVTVIIVQHHSSPYRLHHNLNRLNHSQRSLDIFLSFVNSDDSPRGFPGTRPSVDAHYSLSAQIRFSRPSRPHSHLLQRRSCRSNPRHHAEAHSPGCCGQVLDGQDTHERRGTQAHGKQQKGSFLQFGLLLRLLPAFLFIRQDFVSIGAAPVWRQPLGLGGIFGLQ